MHKQDLEQALAELEKNRSAMERQLKIFAQTDLLFFFSEKPELKKRQQEMWQPILNWAQAELQIKIAVTDELEVPDNRELVAALDGVFARMGDGQFCCWYAAMLNMRSVLLGLALVEGPLTADEAFLLAQAEELWQNERWGEDAKAAKLRQAQLNDLQVIEEFNRQCAM